MDHLVFVENYETFSFMILTLKTGILLVNLHEEVLSFTGTALFYCATTTTFAMLMLSTRVSNDSAVLTVILPGCW